MSENAAEQPEYPPRTAKFLSWSALQFVTRPSPRWLAFSTLAMMALLALAAASLPMLQVDVRIPAVGVVAADPNALPAVALEDGTVDAWLIPPGMRVRKGEPIAALQLGPGGEAIPRIVRQLQDNVPMLASLDQTRKVPSGLETGSSLETFPDPNVRERANALESAYHKLQVAMENHLEYADARDQFVDADRQLRGALVDYIERHQVRAPATGTLLRFEQPLHAAVVRGTSVATVLPREAALIARLTVEARNSAQLSVGQTVTHRLEAFPYQEYGVFGGVVTRIDQAADPQQGVVYVLRATITAPPRLPPRLASRVRLMQGMRSSSSVIVGRKRLLDLAIETLFGKR